MPVSIMPTIYPTSKVCPHTKVAMGHLTSIGDFSFICCAELVMASGSMIARFVEVSGRGKVTLGEDAVVSSHASLLTSSDMPEGKMNDASPEPERAVKTGDIVLGEHSYVGQHATIMPGVTIGDWAVVGAYSYIDKDVKAHYIVHPEQSMMVKPRVTRHPG
jgi:acetyltransferase-like isoleucine patch superfamily enzyme